MANHNPSKRDKIRLALTSPAPVMSALRVIVGPSVHRRTIEMWSQATEGNALKPDVIVLPAGAR